MNINELIARLNEAERSTGAATGLALDFMGWGITFEHESGASIALLKRGTELIATVECDPTQKPLVWRLV